ncbi:hypothetical protein L2E82_07988 [Cichorium intybus]|uniref:Uncharacterized protein n=1 Tax=Cichorium intybus TaxID=13427 RepID=A0ACB9G5A7_CICIN|nr:hypothetical protein L2E82_07988 [Cichorium intybus]
MDKITYCILRFPISYLLTPLSPPIALTNVSGLSRNPMLRKWRQPPPLSLPLDIRTHTHLPPLLDLSEEDLDQNVEHQAERLGLWKQGQFGQVWINGAGTAYLQVPFIAMYRKEECRSLFKDPDLDPEADKDSKSNSEDKPMLTSQLVLWAILELDRKWLLLQKQ